MHARETQLKTVLEGVKQFQVPLFQRRYTWGIEQHTQLWRDVMSQYESLAQAQAEGRESAHRATHFIGSFVLAPMVSGAASVSRFLVVDGQQRLTTLTLALCALRDVWAAIDQQAGEEINELYLINKFRLGDERYKVLPTQDDRQDYFAIVDAAPDKASTDSRVSEAYRYFLAQIGETTSADEDDAIELARLKSVLVSRLSVVDITADHDDNVHRIFESLNATGVDLSQGDLLRNYIFMLLRSEGRAERVYRDLWKPIEDQIGADNIEGLARLDLLRRGEEVLSDDVYRSQQERLRPMESDEDAVEAEVADLLTQARFYSRILDPATEQDTSVRLHLSFFKRWGAQTVNPVVMCAYNMRESGRLSANEMPELLLNIQSFLVRRLLTGVRTGNLNRIFLRVVRRMLEANGQSIIDTVRSELSGERMFWASDAEIRVAVRTRPFYFYGRAEQKRMILEAFEEHLGHREASDLREMPLSIEHILPQAMTDEWRAHLANLGDDPEAVHVELVHTLGNLTLTAYNSPLSNKPLERKQEIYEKSLLAMNQPIAIAPSWGRDAILARADALADAAIDIWPAPPIQTDTAGEFWAPLHEACAVIPSGYWTAYSDIATLVGTSPIAVGSYIGKKHVVNGWRVMTSAGEVAAGFHWLESEDAPNIHDLLSAEGLLFDSAGRADASRRLSAAQLQERIAATMGEAD